MNYALWIVKKNHLSNMIKKISDAHGADNIVWLRDYCQEVLSRCKDSAIDEAILCFTDLVEQLKYVPRRTL